MNSKYDSDWESLFDNDKPEEQAVARPAPDNFIGVEEEWASKPKRELSTAERIGSDVSLALKAAGTGLYSGLVDEAPAAIGGAIRGKEVGVSDTGAVDRWIAMNEKEAAEKALSEEEKQRKLFGVISAGELESAGRSSARSMVTMLPQLAAEYGIGRPLGGVIGGVIGSAIPGAGTAAGAAAGQAIGGKLVGGAAGYGIAKRADMNAVLRQKRDQLLQINPNMSEAEWSQVKKDIYKYVEDHGTAEGAWEAFGNAAQISFLKLGNQWAKRLTPTVGRRVKALIGGVIADLPFEIGSEVKTQQSQTKAERGMGLREQGPDQTFMEALGEVGPTTAASTLMTMGLGGVASQTVGATRRVANTVDSAIRGDEAANDVLRENLAPENIDSFLSEMEAEAKADTEIVPTTPQAPNEREHPNYLGYRQANMTDAEAVAAVREDMASEAMTDDEVRKTPEYKAYSDVKLPDADALAYAREDIAKSVFDSAKKISESGVVSKPVFDVVSPEKRREQKPVESVIPSAPIDQTLVANIANPLVAQESFNSAIAPFRAKQRRIAAEKRDAEFADNVKKADKIDAVLAEMDIVLDGVDNSFIENNASLFDQIEKAIAKNNPQMAIDAANVIARRARNRKKQLRRSTSTLSDQPRVETETVPSESAIPAIETTTPPTVDTTAPQQESTGQADQGIGGAVAPPLEGRTARAMPSPPQPQVEEEQAGEAVAAPVVSTETPVGETQAPLLPADETQAVPTPPKDGRTAKASPTEPAKPALTEKALPTPAATTPAKGLTAKALPQKVEATEAQVGKPTEMMSPEELGAYQKSERVAEATKRLEDAKSGKELPSVYSNGAKSKAALVRMRQLELDAEIAKPAKADIWNEMLNAASKKNPISSALIDGLDQTSTGGVASLRDQAIDNLSGKGYVREGDRYVYRGEKVGKQAPQPGLKPAALPAQPATEAAASVVVEQKKDGDVVVSVPSAEKKVVPPAAQKKFFVAEVDKAIEIAPESQKRPSVEADNDLAEYNKNLRKSVDKSNTDVSESRLAPLFEKYKINGLPNYEKRTEALYNRINSAIEKQVFDASDKITIEVPGDGTFTVLNTKENLRNIKKKMATAFAVPSATVPSTPRGTPAPVAKVGKRPSPVATDLWNKILEPFTAQGKDGKSGRPQLAKPNYNKESGEAVATDSRRLVVVLGVKPSEKAVEGFPKYDQVVPGYKAGKLPDVAKTHSSVTITDTESFARKLNQALAVVKDTVETVVLYKMPDGSVAVEAKAENVGEYGSADIENGEPIGAFNIDFLREAVDFMRKTGNESATIKYVDETSPVLIVGKQEYIVQMPVRRSSIPSDQQATLPLSTKALADKLRNRVGRFARVLENADGTIELVAASGASINVSSTEGGRNGEAGSWSMSGGKNRITLANDTEVSHEITHAMRDLGMISDKEWGVLVDTARKNVDADAIRARYEAAGVALSDADLDHEAVASYVNDVAEGRIDAGANRNAIQKIIDFLKDLASAVGVGQGSAKSVVERTARGEQLGRGDGVVADAATRKSIEDADRAYLAAVERGDMETAQRIVDDAAKAAGYTERMFHGTDESRNIFDGGMFFTDSEKDASAYAEMKALQRAVEENDELLEIVYDVISEMGGEDITDLGPKAIADIADANGIYVPTNDGFVLTARVKATNPLDLREYGSDVGNVRDLWNDLNEKGLLDESWDSLDPETQQEIKDDYKGKALYVFLEKEGVQSKAFDSGYDALYFTDISPDGGSTHTSMLVKENTQFKSSEALVRDDTGRIIPPSERFNPKNDDIRFSIKSDERINKQVAKGLYDNATVEPHVKKNGETVYRIVHGKRSVATFATREKAIEEMNKRGSRLNDVIMAAEGYGVDTVESVAELRRKHAGDLKKKIEARDSIIDSLYNFDTMKAESGKEFFRRMKELGLTEYATAKNVKPIVLAIMKAKNEGRLERANDLATHFVEEKLSKKAAKILMKNLEKKIETKIHEDTKVKIAPKNFAEIAKTVSDINKYMEMPNDAVEDRIEALAKREELAGTDDSSGNVIEELSDAEVIERQLLSVFGGLKHDASFDKVSAAYEQMKEIVKTGVAKRKAIEAARRAEARKIEDGITAQMAPKGVDTTRALAAAGMKQPFRKTWNAIESLVQASGLYKMMNRTDKESVAETVIEPKQREAQNVAAEMSAKTKEDSTTAIADIFGIDLKNGGRKAISAYQKVIAMLGQRPADNEKTGVFARGKPIKDEAGNVTGYEPNQEIRLSRDEMLSAWLAAQQAIIQANQEFTNEPNDELGNTKLMKQLIHNGYTAETFKQMEKYLGPKTIALGDWMVNYIDENARPKAEKVMAEMFGAIPDMVEGYFPLARLFFSGPPESSGARTTQSMLLSWMKTRKNTTADFKAHSAIGTFMRHMDEVAHVSAHAEVVNLVNRVFGNQRMQKNISDQMGDGFRNHLNTHHQMIAGGGIPGFARAIGAPINRFVHGFSRAVTSSVPVMLKQMTSPHMILAYRPPGTSLAKLIMESVALQANPLALRKANKEWNNDPYFKRYYNYRYSKGWSQNTEIALSKDGIKAVSLKDNPLFSAYFNFARWGDKVSVLSGGVPLFNAWLAHNKKIGMSDAAARKDAFDRVQAAIEKTQQSGAAKDISYVQQQPLLKFLWMFASSPVAITSLYANNVRDFVYNPSKRMDAIKNIVLIHLSAALFSAVSEALFSAAIDDDDEWKRIGRNMALSQALLPLIGFVPLYTFAEQYLKSETDEAVGTRSMGRDISSSMLPLASIWDKAFEMAKAPGKLLRADDQEEMEKAIWSMMEGLSTVVGAKTGLPFPPMLRNIRGAKEAWEAGDEPALARIMRAAGFGQQVTGVGGRKSGQSTGGMFPTSESMYYNFGQ